MLPDFNTAATSVAAFLLDLIVITNHDVIEMMMAMAKLIDAPLSLLPLVDNENVEGQYIIIEGKYFQTFRLITKERGQILDFKIATNLQDLMYYVFKTVTFSMAINLEQGSLKTDGDFRKRLLIKQLDLLKVLSKEFHDRFNQEKNKLSY
ncbi:hypothetical protein CAP35_00350 [Chitinophagaceae bacterium IBVUCB1]|nr:hypothetical protein CAP35_00350 [Chitinophagaceae bacterium IBVUCB1]